MAEVDEARLEALEAWARENATQNTARFDREAEAAQMVLELFTLDQIGHGA